MEGNCNRWQAALTARRWVGLTGVPMLMPRAAAGVDANQLPFFNWTLDGQRALARAYALADGRCPVIGCEPAPVDQHTRPRHLTPIATFSPGRDSDGFLTGEGILEGAVAGTAGGDVRLRGDTLYAHWLAFHMQCGLTLTFPCPIPGYAHCDGLDGGSPIIFTNPEALYRHLTRYHSTECQHLIRDVGPRREKKAIMEKIITPLLQP